MQLINILHLNIYLYFWGLFFILKPTKLKKIDKRFYANQKYEVVTVKRSLCLVF